MSAIEIKPDRLERFFSPDVHLRSGNGRGVSGTFDACVVQATDWLTGGDGSSDSPECVDPVIRSFCIRLNDASVYSAWRDDLKPFAPRIANTNVGREATVKRAFMCADWAIRVLAPMWFEFWAEHAPERADEAKGWAQKLRDVAPIVDKDSAEAGRAIARDAAYAAYAASAAYAAYAAYAASAAYAAYAADAASAAYAADAASAAYAADAALTRRLWDESLRFLGELIAVTEPA